MEKHGNTENYPRYTICLQELLQRVKVFTVQDVPEVNRVGLPLALWIELKRPSHLQIDEDLLAMVPSDTLDEVHIYNDAVYN